MKAKNLIVFCDMRALPVLGFSDKETIELYKRMADFCCHLAEERKTNAVSIFDMLPEKNLTPERIRTDFFSQNMVGIIQDELPHYEAVAVIENLGKASRIPEDVKKVCDESFKTIKPFSWFFDKNTGDSLKSELTRQYGIIENRGRLPAPLLRGGRKR